MHLQRTFQVAGFVLVHDIVLGQLVQHRSNLREKCLGRTLVRRVAECFHGVLWKRRLCARLATV